MSTKKFFDIHSLEEKFGPMTVGLFLRAFREADGLSQTEFGKKLKLSRANVCDLEKGRKNIRPERAKQIAKILGVPETVLIQLALQDTLRDAKLNYTVELKKVSGL
jgi:transcriptional regulator with XRE-family HTH domain